VLGSTPKDFFDEPKNNVQVVYSTDNQTIYTDDEMKYSIRWLVPRSIENEMEPVHITFLAQGEFKKFEPSFAETFIYVLKGKVALVIGNAQHIASKGDAIYYDASEHHWLSNASNGTSELLLVATESYL
jgi:quercetin dioxygenase-like cupin family protein